MKKLRIYFCGLFLLFLNTALFSQTSTSKLDSLTVAYSSASTDTSKYMVMINLCAEFEAMAFYDRGLDTANALVKYAKQTHHDYYIASGFQNAAVFLNRKSQYDEALKNCDSTIYYAGKIKNQKIISTAFIAYALVYGHLGKLDSSLMYNFKALKIDSMRADKKRMGNTLNNIGYIYLQKDNYLKANEYFFKSLKIAEETSNDRVIGNCLINIGAVYANMEKYDLSEEYFAKCYEVRKRTNNKQGLAAVLANFAEIYQLQGKLELALSKAYESLTYSVPIGYFPNIVTVYMMMSNCYLKAEQTDSAFHYAQKAVALSKEKKIQNLLPESLLASGNVLLKKNELAESKKAYEEAIALAEKIGRKGVVKTAYNQLSLIAEMQNDHKAALDYFKKFKTADDSLLNEANQKELTKLEVEYNTQKKEKEIVQLNFDKQQREIFLQKNRLALTQAELENKDKQQQLEKSEAARRLNELELKEAENKNKILLLQKQKEAEQNKAEIQRQAFVNYILTGGIAALVLISVFVMGYFMQRQKTVHHQKEIEKQKAVIEERNRIANDMHDDLGAGLSTIKMMGEMAMAKSSGNGNNEMQKVTQSASELIDSMRAIVWSISSRNDSLEDLILYIRKYSFEYLEPHKIECIMELPENILQIRLSAEQRRNIFLVVKESLHNTVKHANATQVEIKVKTNPVFAISIHDNGEGYEAVNVNRFGNGLKNMQRRMESINGSFTIENKQGTTIKCECIFDKNLIT